MSESIYKTMQNNQMLREFNEFKRRYANIDPQQEVMNMLRNGRITQQQLNEAQRRASALSQILK